MTQAVAVRTSVPAAPAEGITVIGEAVRGVAPESAEFLIEITSSAPTATHVLRDIHTRASQLTEALTPLGVEQRDVQSISVNVQNLYVTPAQHLPVYGAIPQIASMAAPGGMAIPGAIPGTMQGYGAATAMQPEMQFGMYYARQMLRVTVRDARRAGEIADLCGKAGATLAGSVTFRANDESSARRAVLEAAGKDAQAKAEGLAAATGKHAGEPIGITEDFVVCNGMVAAIRAVAPFAIGSAAPAATGELEYYARVTATFRWQ